MKSISVYLVILLTFFNSVLLSQTISLQYAVPFLGAGGQIEMDCMTRDAGNNVLLGGTFSGGIDFDPGPGTSILTTTNILESFIVKLDGNGALIWAKQIGGSATGTGIYGIDVDAANNIYATGSFIGTVDLDPGPGTFTFTSGMAGDIFVLKLDGAGNFLWAKIISNPGGDNSGLALKIDGDGNIVSGGFFLGPLDMDPGPGTSILTASSPSCNAYVSKLDANGNFVWAKQFVGSNGGDIARSLYTDAAKNIYITGHFTGIIDLDPGIGTSTFTASGNKDAFIVKLDLNGIYQWGFTMGNSGYDGGRCIVTDASTNVIAVGVFSNSIDLDPGIGSYTLSSTSALNSYIAKYSTAGNFIWAKQIASNVSNEVFSVAVDLAGNIYAAGSFSGSADFDPGVGTFSLTSNGDHDGYLLKLDANGNFLWAFQTGTTNLDVNKLVKLDLNEKIIVAGKFNGTCDFDPSNQTFSLSAIGSNNGFTSKYCQNCNTNLENSDSMRSFLTIHPHPCNDLLSISHPDNVMLKEILLYDALGKIVLCLNEEYLKDNDSVSVKDLPSGFYTLRIDEKGGHSEIEKLLIIH